MDQHFINRSPKNTKVEFRGSDQLKSFRKNLKTQPLDWIYRTKKIKYSYNEQGFRTRSFHTTDWRESVVVFGCSCVEGIGLAEQDTFAAQLENTIQRPVINLGVGGSGVDVACWNSVALRENYPTPKAIIHMWPMLDRYADYDLNSLSLCTPMHRGYYHRLNWEFRSAKYIQADRALWKHTVPYLEGTFFDCKADHLQIPKFSIIDRARDLSHPGIESNRLASAYFAQLLESQL